MWPWGHLAVGYLLYAVTLWYLNRVADESAVALLALGTQFPDLVDKPLAWAGVLPGGRALAHSLLFALPAVAVVLLVAERRGVLGVGAGFSLGYLSHLAADSTHSLAAGAYGELTFLVWPLRSLPDYERDSPLDHLHALAEATQQANPAGVLQDPMGAFTGQVLLLALAAWAWTRHGRPGLSLLRRRLGRGSRRTHE